MVVRFSFGRFGLVATKTNHLVRSKIVFQKAHPRDGFSLSPERPFVAEAV